VAALGVGEGVVHWFDRFAAQAAARSDAPVSGPPDPARASRRGFLTKIAAVGGGAAATAAVLPMDRAGAASCAPNTLCGSICVNTSKDQDNCGACGHVCAPGELCSLGKCCPCGSVNCGGVCVDVWHDPANCGRCGHHCRNGQVCKSGKCVTQYTSGCSVASDCGTSTTCKTFTCTAGVCGSTFAASGVVVSGQTAGDCKVNVCDGAGNIVMQVDNTDTPASAACQTGICTGGTPGFTLSAAGSACAGGTCDGQGVCVGTSQCSVPSDCAPPPNVCTVNTCVAGVCGTVAASSGTVCAGGNCDGAGNCVSNAQCSVPSDCGSPPNECWVNTCVEGVCGTVGAPSGTPISSQIAGDCLINVCISPGVWTAIIDPNDTPTPPGPCQVGICNGPVPGFVDVEPGTICDGGSGVCDGQGNCVPL
jgi:hypothetical protein